MSNVVAGIGRGQLRVLDERVAKKRYIFEFYKKELTNLSEIEFMPENDWDESNFWLSCILLKGKTNPVEIIEALDEENIESRPIWKPMHLQPFYKDCDYVTAEEGISVSDDIFARGVCLPSDSKMTDFNLSRVANIIKRLLSQRG